VDTGVFWVGMGQGVGHCGDTSTNVSAVLIICKYVKYIVGKCYITVESAG
jgi:hypothetical protein